MAPGGDGKANPGGGAKGGGRKRKFLPHGKPVRKGAYPLRPGVQGFFITCDGGRERQATREALSLLDSVSHSLRLRFPVPVHGWRPACSVGDAATWVRPLRRGRRTHARCLSHYPRQPGQVEGTVSCRGLVGGSAGGVPANEWLLATDSIAWA